MRIAKLLVGGVFLSVLSTMAFSAEEQELDFKGEIQRLNQRITDLEEQVVHTEFASPKESLDGKERIQTVYDEGYYFFCHNDTLRIAGFSQVDYRKFFDKHSGIDQFLIRRARLDIRGVLEGVWGYRLYMSFGGTSGAQLQQMWLEYVKWEWCRIRAGQFKEPFSIGALTSSAMLRFVERGLGPTNLAPFEDIGIQVFGSLDCDKWIYAFGFFNGQGKNRSDLDDSKDFAARICYQPFRYYCDSIFQGLHVGSSMTTGYNKFDLDGKKYYTGLRTPFQTFGDDVEQRGNLFRVGAELDWCCGPFWVGGEYIYHRRHGVKTTHYSEAVKTNSWYLGVGYILTGEYQLKNSVVKPFRDFDPCGCNAWGAWEVNARYEELQTNHKPFEKGLIVGTDKVREYTAGVVWWPNDVHVKIQGNFIYSDFDDNVVVHGHKLGSEKGVVFRGQYIF